MPPPFTDALAATQFPPRRPATGPEEPGPVDELLDELLLGEDDELEQRLELPGLLSSHPSASFP